MMSFCISVTGLIGMIMPGIWFSGFDIHDDDAQEKGRKLQLSLNIVQAFMITCMMIPNLMFFRDKPPTPPSHSAEIEKADFSEAMLILQNSRSYQLICISFAIFYGCFNLIGAILSFVLKPFGLGDPILSSILSVIPIFSGVIGCILQSNYLKKYLGFILCFFRYQKYKFTTLFCMVGVTSSIMFFLLMLWTGVFLAILLPTFLVGLFMVPLIPTMLEFACEI